MCQKIVIIVELQFVDISTVIEFVVHSYFLNHTTQGLYIYNKFMLLNIGKQILSQSCKQGKIHILMLKLTYDKTVI